MPTWKKAKSNSHNQTQGLKQNYRPDTKAPVKSASVAFTAVEKPISYILSEKNGLYKPKINCSPCASIQLSKQKETMELVAWKQLINI